MLTSWRDSGYERFTLVFETNCKRQPAGQLALIILLTILGNIMQQGYQNYISKVAMETLMTAGDSLTDVCLVVKMSRVVVVSLQK